MHEHSMHEHSMHEHSHGDSGPAAEDAFETARQGDAVRLRQALVAGLAAGASNPAGDSLLMLAAYHGHEDVVALLLEHGADPDTSNVRGQHPLAGVCYRGHAAIAHRLLEAGANPEGSVSAARSPLMYAAMYNHASTTRLLLSHGADAARRTPEGKNALDLAREMRAVHTIPLLEALS